MALYGRASSSTYNRLFLASGQISHLLAYIPRPFFHRVAFSAPSCFNTPAPILAAWLFVPFLASTPRYVLSTAWLFKPLLLLYPRAALGRVAFSAPSRFYAPHRSWPRGLFSPISLQSPAPIIRAGLFSPFSVSISHLHRKCSLYMDMFCHHTQKNSLIKVCLFDKFFTVL